MDGVKAEPSWVPAAGGDPVLCAPTPPVLPGAAEVVLGLIRENYRVLGRLLLTDAAWVEVKEKGENQGQRRGEKKTRWGGRTRHQRR